MDSLIAAQLMGHTDAKMLERTYFREENRAMVEAMERARGGDRTESFMQTNRKPGFSATEKSATMG